MSTNVKTQLFAINMQTASIQKGVILAHAIWDTMAMAPTARMRMNVRVMNLVTKMHHASIRRVALPVNAMMGSLAMESEKRVAKVWLNMITRMQIVHQLSGKCECKIKKNWSKSSPEWSQRWLKIYNFLYFNSLQSFKDWNWVCDLRPKRKMFCQG